MPPGEGLLIERSFSMRKRSYSRMFLILTTGMFQSFGFTLLILSGPLFLPLLISFPNLKTWSDLRDVMDREEVLPGSVKQTKVSVPFAKVALRT